MTTHQSKLDRRELSILLTLALVMFTNIMDFMIMMPLGAQLMPLFDITPAQFSVLVSAYTFTAGTVGFFSSFMMDRFDRKTALTRIYFGFTIGTFLCAMAPGYELLLFARAATGIFGGMLSALSMSITGDLIPFERRGRAVGIVMTSFSAASVFGVPFGLFLANKFSWHAPFVFLGIIGLFIQFAIWKVIPPVNAHLGGVKESPLALLRHVAKNKHQIFALSLIPVLMLGHFTIIPFLSPYMVSNVGFTNDQLTYIYLFGGLCTIFTSPIIGRVVDRTGGIPIFSIFAILALIPVWLITHMGPTPIPMVLLVTTSFFIIGGGRMVPATAIVTSAIEPKHRGGFLSLNSSMQQLFSGVASLVAGMIVTRDAAGKLVNYNLICYLTIVASLVCIYIAHQTRPQPK